jgi:glutamine phosphoribosylpyrophosphate amidotransferase
MCGIVAVLMANKEAMAVADLYEALNLLQHRGQVCCASELMQ